MARPRFTVTAENRSAVEKMAAIGVSEENIAKVLSIDPKTLRKHFRVDLSRGDAKGEVGLKQKAYQKAMDGDGPMLKYLLEKRESRQNRGYQPNGLGPPCNPADVRAKIDKLLNRRREALQEKKLSGEDLTAPVTG